MDKSLIRRDGRVGPFVTLTTLNSAIGGGCYKVEDTITELDPYLHPTETPIVSILNTQN
jgi:hypothetical protein